MNPKKKQQHHETTLQQIKGVGLVAAALLLSLALISFGLHASAKNLLGLLGSFLGSLCHLSLGISCYILPVTMFWLGLRYLKGEPPIHLKTRAFFSLLAMLSFSLLLTVFEDTFPEKALSLQTFFYSYLTSKGRPPFLGGVPSHVLYQDLPFINLKLLISQAGVILLSSIALLVSLVYLTKLSLVQLAEKVQEKLSQERESPSFRSQLKLKLPTLKKKEKPIETSVLPEPKDRTISFAKYSIPKLLETKAKKGYTLPPLSLLTNPKTVDQTSLKKDLKKQAEVLEETLLSFGIEAKVGQINCGPTITSFEVHPAIGVKVQKIKALENDIALNMQAKTIRIIAPIPGKAAVGIEVPNPCPQEVGFKELVAHYQQHAKKFHVPLHLGKTAHGEFVTTDLTKMPHCIIAGATGSGKSVCINTIIMAILYSMSPDEIKLLLIDPKKVELTPYSNLPHMIAPVVTEPHGAACALQWLVREMERRYELLKQLGVRNIEAFNHSKRDPQLIASLSIDVPEKLPYIVGIIDELADLMMVSQNDIETPIARIAQMARAVGIHLILATQRPSREVITGLIKANFPTRISFKVASRINSQIILDEVGAESLLGNGDLLFLPPGTSQLVRAQGAYISDEDMKKVLTFIAKQKPADYLIESFDEMGIEQSSKANQDPLFEEAKKLVKTFQNASTTFLQRKLKIGYARAASLMDLLEDEGIISPPQGSKGREVYSPDDHA